MGNKIEYTEEQLTEAVKDSNSSKAVANLLGFKENAPMRLRKDIKRKLTELKTDLSTWIFANRDYRKRRSWTEEQFKQAVKDNCTVAGVLRQLGLTIHGCNHIMVKKMVKELGLDTSHFNGKNHSKGKTISYSAVKIPLDKLLTKDCNYGSSQLKKRLLNENRIKNECDICKLNKWQEKPLVCQLDHINGDNTDNRIENLRLLCPNCHSQTKTFCRKKSALDKNNN